MGGVSPISRSQLRIHSSLVETIKLGAAAMHADTLSLIQRFHSPPGAAGGAVLAARVTELQIRLQAAHQELAAERLAAQAAKELVLQNADRCAVELVRQVREAQARASKNVGALRDTLVQRDLETRELREALARRDRATTRRRARRRRRGRRGRRRRTSGRRSVAGRRRGARGVGQAAHRYGANAAGGRRRRRPRRG